MSYPMKMSDESMEALLAAVPFPTGTRREVFLVPSDRGVVIKRMRHAFPGANFVEWQIWHSIKETDLKDVFGECIAISESGRYLMMEFLGDITQADLADTPPVPDWWNDVKGHEPFGRSAGGLIKVRDYDVLNYGDALAAAPRLARWKPLRL